MTSQQPPERRPKKVDLDLLPTEYQPRKVSKLSIALVCIAVLMLCLPVLFVLLKADVNDEKERLETQLSELTSELADLNKVKTQAQSLLAQIDAAEQKLETTREDYETFLENRLLWSDVITEIDDLIPGKRVSIVSIKQGGSSITLTGSATRDDYVVEFAAALEGSEYFSHVSDITYSAPGEAASFTMIVHLSSGGGS
jgi:Tfp pilus assembly protein PilN